MGEVAKKTRRHFWTIVIWTGYLKHPLIQLKILLLNQMDGLLHTQERKKHQVPHLLGLHQTVALFMKGFHLLEAIGMYGLRYFQ